MPIVSRCRQAGPWVAGLVGLAAIGLAIWGGSSSLRGHSNPEPVPEPTPARFPLFSAATFESAGYGTAVSYTGPIRDRANLDEQRDAIQARVPYGVKSRQADLQSIPPGVPDPALRALRDRAALAALAMYEGDFQGATSWLEKAIASPEDVPWDLRANFEVLLGVVHLRRGETENCLECRGPSSCIFPIDRAAVHLRPSGSRTAIQHFTNYLKKRPEDLGVRWLLNLAYMTLGEYPDGVPPRYRISLRTFQSALDVGRFANVAPEAGLGSRGANMAGGAVFDDFDGDNRPDLFLATLDTNLDASLFRNRGDGTFEDRSDSTALTGQGMVVNATQADFDNDGRLDLVLLRGGWESPSRLTLLHNLGGTFEDVTVASGLDAPIASHSAAWGDFDNDGWVDLFVCGEYVAATGVGLFGAEATLPIGDPRNHSRLYRNQGDGTFRDVAADLGVTNDRYAKGAVWGDFDDDGWIDLFVSNMDGENRLYRNQGGRSFVDVAESLGVTGPRVAFACGFSDFDNDGRLDLLVVDYQGTVFDAVASSIGRAPTRPSHPRLYRNLGSEGFRDIAPEAGLNRVILSMGLGVGDIDEDGFPDIYFGTGRPDYSSLLPNLLYKNVQGRKFVDVTTSSGTGHLQKGHAIALADFDDDGDLDIFSELGGAVPGDRAYNVLYQNPGHGRHWLKLKLQGRRSNRAALGAQIRLDLVEEGDRPRSIYRTIGNASSYGGNSLVETIGLGGSSVIESLTVTWPASKTRQVFHDLQPDQMLEIIEGQDEVRVLKPGASSRSAEPRPGLTSTRPLAN